MDVEVPGRFSAEALLSPPCPLLVPALLIDLLMKAERWASVVSVDATPSPPQPLASASPHSRSFFRSWPLLMAPVLVRGLHG